MAASTLRVSLLLLLNLFSSLSIVFVNKWLFFYSKFPSVTLTFINFCGTSIGLYLCLAVGFFKRKSVAIRDVIPLSLSFCGFVVFTNLSLKFNTVGTYQLLKVLTTPVIIFLNWRWYRKASSRYVKLSLVPIFFGIFINSMYDLEYSATGTFWALLGVMTTAIYQILVHQKQKELGLDSMQLLSYQAPLSSVMLLFILPFLENPFSSDGIFSISFSSETFGLVLLSTTAAFSVNFTIYWIIANTSAITYNFFGHFKFCATLLGGFFIFGNTITTNQGVGIILTLIGVFSYSRLKFKENKERSLSLPTQKPESKP
jgi:solute carrier family 35 protein E3